MGGPVSETPDRPLFNPGWSVPPEHPNCRAAWQPDRFRVAGPAEVDLDAMTVTWGPLLGPRLSATGPARIEGEGIPTLLLTPNEATRWRVYLAGGDFRDPYPLGELEVERVPGRAGWAVEAWIWSPVASPLFSRHVDVVRPLEATAGDAVPATFATVEDALRLGAYVMTRPGPPAHFPIIGRKADG